jgi:glutaredoxin
VSQAFSQLSTGILYIQIKHPALIGCFTLIYHTLSKGSNTSTTMPTAVPVATVTISRPEEGIPVQLYFSSATSFLKSKKDAIRLRVLLDAKRVYYEEFDISLDQMRKSEMVEKSGLSCIPQLFINGKYIGVRTGIIIRELF